MKTFIFVLSMGIFSGLLALFGCGEKEVTNQNLAESEQKVISFEKQLRNFKELGVALNPTIEKSELKRWGDEKLFEKEPFSLLYMTLGQTIEKEPWTPITNRCWDFDFEAIEDHGDYGRIIRNFERISRGELKFENLKDFVDVENEKAWVSFKIGNEEIKWDLEVDNDWVDIGLFSNLVKLTNRLKTKGKFTVFETGGQNAVFGFETPEKRKEIIKATGLKIDWLD